MMREPSGTRRFLGELRRRRVPETAAVYLVAAWAAIEFADVVAPNLGWPQAVVTAVIIAAAVGFPVVLVLAWIFDWGPRGLHRTEDLEREARIGRTHGEAGASGGGRSSAWIAAVAVLAVGIASALAVAVFLDGGAADEGAGEQAGGPARETGSPGGHPPIPPVPEGLFSEEWEASIREAVGRGLGSLDGLDSALAERGVGRRFGEDRALLIYQPEEWLLGNAPRVLAEGDVLQVQGVARDSAGVASVSVDGAVVAEADPPGAILRFEAGVRGEGIEGTRTVRIRVETGDGREIIREYRVHQVPGGG